MKGTCTVTVEREVFVPAKSDADAVPQRTKIIDKAKKAFNNFFFIYFPPLMIHDKKTVIF
jgi:hypothetical protein